VRFCDLHAISLCVTALGSIIVIEFVIIFSLGLLLLYFTCKCAILLVHERRKKEKRSSEPSNDQSSQGQTVSAQLKATMFVFSGMDSHMLKFNKIVSQEN
jgi:hypothetical protein